MQSLEIVILHQGEMPSCEEEAQDARDIRTVFAARLAHARVSTRSGCLTCRIGLRGGACRGPAVVADRLVLLR